MPKRIVTFTPPQPNDYVSVRQYAVGIYSHNMYDQVNKLVRETPGFVMKESLVEESKTGAILRVTLTFDTLENFDAYLSDEVADSMWEFIKIQAESDGLTVSVVDVRE